MLATYTAIHIDQLLLKLLTILIVGLPRCITIGRQVYHLDYPGKPAISLMGRHNNTAQCTVSFSLVTYKLAWSLLMTDVEWTSVILERIITVYADDGWMVVLERISLCVHCCFVTDLAWTFLCFKSNTSVLHGGAAAGCDWWRCCRWRGWFWLSITVACWCSFLWVVFPVCLQFFGPVIWACLWPFGL